MSVRPSDVAEAAQVPRAGRNRSLAGRFWVAPLPAHAAMLVALLLAVAPYARVGRTFIPDEGLYNLQAKALERGSWVVEPPSASIDPDLRFRPWRASEADGGLVPYDRHPAYPRLIQAASWLTGGVEGALLLLGISGVAATAAGAWLLARELVPGTERVAFWLAASSPVALHGFVQWAHAPAAAMSTWALVFLVLALRCRGFWPWAGFIAVAVAGLLLRSESLLVAGALLGACGVAGVLCRRSDLVIGAAVGGTVCLAATLVERAVVADIGGASNQQLAVRGSGTLTPESSYLSGRVDAAYHTLIEGAQYSTGHARVAQLGVLLIALGSVRSLRRGWEPLSLGLLGCGAILVTVRMAAELGDPIPGLVVAWPIALAGTFGAARLFRHGDIAARIAVGGVGMAVLATLATQYSGRNVQWAGRFLTFAVPLLAVAALAAWSDAVRVARASWSRLVLVVSVGFTVLGLAAVHEARDDYGEIDTAIDGARAEVTITPIRSLGQALWQREEPWMTVPPSELPSALRLVAQGDVSSVAVVWPAWLALSAPGWDVRTVDEAVTPSTFNLAVYRLTPSSSN